MCKRSGLKHTNMSQFYITCGAPLTFMDNQFVVFGRVIYGMRHIREIENLECTNERPNIKVEIKDAREYNCLLYTSDAADE